jgi:hypothetical protein
MVTRPLTIDRTGWLPRGTVMLISRSFEGRSTNGVAINPR